jgi:RNA recognition motif-containing protein
VVSSFLGKDIAMGAPGTRLYIGNLSYSTTDASLRAAFEEGGKKVVDAKVVTDRASGQSRGFGFVELATPEEAQAAISAWDGRDLDGRNLRVAIAQDKPSGGGGGGGGGGGRRGGGGGRGRDRGDY